MNVLIVAGLLLGLMPSMIYGETPQSEMVDAKNPFGVPRLKNKFPQIDGEWENYQVMMYQFPSGLTIQGISSSVGSPDESLFLFFTAKMPSSEAFKTPEEFIERINALVKGRAWFHKKGPWVDLDRTGQMNSMDPDIIKTQRGYEAVRNEALRHFTHTHEHWGNRELAMQKEDQEHTPSPLPPRNPISEENIDAVLTAQSRWKQIGFVGFQSPTGMVLTGVWAMSPAEEAGFEAGEIILQCDDLVLGHLETPEAAQKFLTALYRKKELIPLDIYKDRERLAPEMLKQLLDRFPPGHTVKLKVARRDGSLVTRTLLLP